jgi:hypothetical protein
MSRGKIISLRDEGFGTDGFCGWEFGITKSRAVAERGIESYERKFSLEKTDGLKKLYRTGFFDDGDSYSILIAAVDGEMPNLSIGFSVYVPKALADPEEIETYRKAAIDYMRHRLSESGFVTLKGFGNNETKLYGYLNDIWNRLDLIEVPQSEPIIEGITTLTVFEGLKILREHDEA